MDQIKVKISQEPDIKVKIDQEPEIKVFIDGTRGDKNHTHLLDELENVNISFPIIDQVLKFDGTNWTNQADGGSGGGGPSQVAIQDVFTATLGQTDFTLSQVVSDIAIVTLNGVQQAPIIDYNISGTTLSFVLELEEEDIVIVNYSLPLSGINTYSKRLTSTNLTANNNTSGIMYLDGVNSKLLILQNEVKSFSGTVVMKDLANLGSIASWEIKGCITKFTANNSTQFVGTPTITLIGKTQLAIDNGFNLFIETDTINGALQLRTFFTNGGTTKATATLKLSEVI